MIDPARRQDIHDEASRGDESLRAAETLIAAGLCGDAVSRAYYGAYHYLRALLLSREAEARSHAGAIHLFNTALVQKGSMEARHNRILGGLQRAREMADYDAAVAFTDDDARALVLDAQTFRAAARALLTNEGWLPADEVRP